MEPLLLVDVVSRVTHISTAIALIGGSVFATFVLDPALRATRVDRHKVLESVKVHWKLWVHVGIALFLISGFYNYIRAMPLHRDGGGLYHALIGTKILLALAVMVIASGLVGRSRVFAFMRENAKLWQTALIVLALVIVAISGVAKVRGVPVKSPAADRSALDSHVSQQIADSV